MRRTLTIHACPFFDVTISIELLKDALVRFARLGTAQRNLQGESQMVVSPVRAAIGPRDAHSRRPFRSNQWQPFLLNAHIELLTALYRGCKPSPSWIG